MNIKEYISTGILEAYLLGDLSASEKGEVETALSLYPELKVELSKIEETTERLVNQMAVAPRAHVKEKLFSKIHAQPEAKIIPLTATIRWQYATAASIAFALLASYIAFNYWGKWRQSETNLVNLIAQNERIAKEYNTVNQRLDQLALDIKVTSSPDFARVVMNGTPNAPQAMATVYWNKQTTEVYLGIQDLKQLAQEKQYQLWAIIDGKPVDCGTFDRQFSGLVKMKGIKNLPSTFAVTIEPRGGKPSPTLETMQVAGNLSAG